jgi:DedD protein
MKVDGKEFLRNVGIEEDKEKLKKAQEKLEEQKRNSIKKDPGFFDNNPAEDDAVSLNLSSQQEDPQTSEGEFNNLYDIKLDPDSNGKNRKKYIILIIALILLFTITIVIIRLISNSQEEDKLNSSQQPAQAIEKDSQLDKIKTDEEYQKIISQQDKEENDIFKADTASSKKELILPEPVKEAPPVKIEPKKVEQTKKDLFGINKETPEVKTPEVQKTAETTIEKKKEEVKKVFQKIEKPEPVKQVTVEAPKVTNFVKKESAIAKGYYIQIASFTKKPADRFLTSITKKGYSYKLHKMDIKGKTYNKVLIGVYPSYSAAKDRLPKIKKDLNAPGAYILKL